MTETTAPEHRNEVVLVGEVTAPPEERTLADGRVIVTFRLDVVRDPEVGTGRDSFECTAHAARLRRSLAAWQTGDLVEVSGAIRRRFYRVGAGSRPFMVVEVERARRLSSPASRRRRPA
ncbi:MAG: single-strand DNA-binding protein [Frankiaceae bacterium]|jgi:single-strand DNA-binding protein|nr:single-strand DNA-binding protein [Frankiaceae bacterium]